MEKKKVLGVFGRIFNILFGVLPATGSISSLMTILGWIFPPLVVSFPWAFLFAAVGEHLLVAVFGLADSSALYILLIVLFWVVGLIPLGLVLRNRSRKVYWLVAGSGWAAVLGSAALFTGGNCMAKKPWLAILRRSGCMAMCSPSNMRRRHWLSIPFATNQTKNTSKRSRRRSVSRPPIARRKGGCGNWMTRCGPSPNGSPIMLLANEDGKRARLFNSHCSKSWKQL